MKKRYLYALLFGIPGLFVAGVISLFTFGALAGVLWIFVFGDDPWPLSTNKVLPALFVLVFLLLWIASIAAGYVVGKRLESDPRLDGKHILISGGLTLLFILFIVLQQFNVGNMGHRSDSMLCADFCTQRGYSASGTPAQNSGDRSCTCYDNAGNEALRVPWEDIVPK